MIGPVIARRFEPIGHARGFELAQSSDYMVSFLARLLGRDAESPECTSTVMINLESNIIQRPQRLTFEPLFLKPGVFPVFPTVVCQPFNGRKSVPVAFH